MMCSRQIPSEIRSGIEVVITGLTRNQFVSNHTWVRIPPAAPAQKFPPPLRFRLRRKLRYGGNFFAFGHDSLRWIRGRGETGGTDWGLYLFCQRRTVKRIPTTAPFPASPKTALWWEFLRFRPRFASLDSWPRGDGRYGLGAVSFLSTKDSEKNSRQRSASGFAESCTLAGIFCFQPRPASPGSRLGPPWGRLFYALRGLGTGSFLALDRKNVLRYLLLVGLGQFYESAPVFKSAIVFLYDANDLAEDGRLGPLL